MRQSTSPRSAAAVLLVAAASVLGCGGASKSEAATGSRARPDERFVFFTAASTQIVSRDGFFSLGYVVALLDADPHYYVLVVGHADPSGADEINRQLCFGRARAVRQVLLDHGIDKKRVLIAAPRARVDAMDPSLSRRADIYVYDPVEEEVSHRLGYEVEIREN